HDYPFKLVPISYNESVEALKLIPLEWGAERVIVAIDIPKLVSIATKFMSIGKESVVWDIEAIFPVESHPISPLWVDILGKYKTRYVISRYGVEQCKSAGLTAEYIPMGCSVGKQPASKDGPRELLKWPKDKTIFFTVAANHERKMLPLAMEAFSRLPEEDTQYYILTNPEANIGWNLEDMAEELGIQDRYATIRFGVSEGVLSTMYWAADVFVLPSQAEGACLPVISEAPSHGLPVICGNWTALSDVEDEPWILGLGYDYRYRYPWGNVNRWMASVDDLEHRMLAIHNSDNGYREELKEAALTFARSKPWIEAVDVVEKAIHE
ncbi:MAG: glycosyltransferase, partial [Candidatus Thorarchaeota archaeon]